MGNVRCFYLIGRADVTWEIILHMNLLPPRPDTLPCRPAHGSSRRKHHPCTAHALGRSKHHRARGDRGASGRAGCMSASKVPFVYFKLARPTTAHSVVFSRQTRHGKCSEGAESWSMAQSLFLQPYPTAHTLIVALFLLHHRQDHMSPHTIRSPHPERLLSGDLILALLLLHLSTLSMPLVSAGGMGEGSGGGRRGGRSGGDGGSAARTDQADMGRRPRVRLDPEVPAPNSFFGSHLKSPGAR